MSEHDESAVTALPTRRALREAERAAARIARENSTVPSVTSSEAASVPLEAAVMDATPEIATDAPTTATVATTTERTATKPTATKLTATKPTALRRASSMVAASATKPSTARRWLPRVAVLGALAVATTAVPLSGMATPTGTASSAATFSAVSALDVLDAEQVDGTDAFDGSTSFEADPLAAARAFLTTGRTESRDVLQCGSSELEANGQVAAGATTAPVQIMLPLTTGSYRITSQYGYRWGGKHEGLDMAAPAGTPIHAVAAGEVTYVGYGLGGRSGMIIVLKHEINGETFWTWYIHMYPDGIFVDVGQQVSAGEVIGEVGSYGNSTGPHLHLEVHVDEEFTTVDPAIWLDEHDAAPLTSENLACAGS